MFDASRTAAARIESARSAIEKAAIEAGLEKTLEAALSRLDGIEPAPDQAAKPFPPHRFNPLPSASGAVHYLRGVIAGPDRSMIASIARAARPPFDPRALAALGLAALAPAVWLGYFVLLRKPPRSFPACAVAGASLAAAVALVGIAPLALICSAILFAFGVICKR